MLWFEYSGIAGNPVRIVHDGTIYNAAVSVLQADTYTFLSHGPEKLPYGQPDLHDAA